MENRHRTYQRQSMGLVFFLFVLVLLTLLGRLFYLMIGKADYYGVQAKELHERERKIKAERGEIKDCHGNVLAANRSVSTISVIHSQMKEPESGDNPFVEGIDVRRERGSEKSGEGFSA